MTEPVSVCLGSSMDERAERFMQALGAFVEGDLATVQQMFSPNVRAVWGGNSPYSGDYNGVGATLALLAHTKDWFDPASIEITSIAPTDNGLVIEETATLRDLLSGDRLEGVRFRLHVTFDEEGRIDFIENTPRDQAIDIYLNREHERRNAT